MAGGIEHSVTAERIGAALDAAAFVWELDGDGDFHLPCEEGAIWFMRRGEDWNSAYMFALWKGRLPEGELTDAILMCNSWNAEHFVPKAYAKRNEEGGVRLYGDQLLRMSFGCSDDTLNSEVSFLVGCALQMFEYFTEIFPD